MREGSETSAGTVRLGGRAAYASGAIGTIGLAFFVAMYVSFALDSSAVGAFGWLNDVLVMVQYLVAVPIAVALHALHGARNPALSRFAMVVGISGMFATAALQFLLVIGALTFAQQVVPVSVALLVVGAWLVITGYLGRSTGTLPHGVRMSLLAVLYVGYPIWAFWLGRRLLAQNHPER